MRRREFLGVLAAGSAGGASAAALGLDPVLALRWIGVQSIHQRLIEQNDASLERLLEVQQLEATHPAYGGIPDAYEIYHAGAAAGLLSSAAVAFVSPSSRRYRDPQLLARMVLATDFLRRFQHADGTIDLLTTNFHSTPDLAFVMEWVCFAMGLLRADGEERSAALRASLELFIRAGAEALSVGGIHTPNHRWVVCMALARAHTLGPDPRYLARIEAWLGEGIDIDPDGQFTERSTSVYSPLTDRWLITLARLLKRPALLAPVRRNLEMTLYYLHADGEIVTEGSRRQDQYLRKTLAPYYYSYRYLALHDDNPRFAAAARSIEESEMAALTGFAPFFVEDPELGRELPAGAALPSDYEKHFVHSQLVRIRRGTLSATILGENPVFLSLHRGSAALVMRFASAFFGKGQFVGSAPRKQGDAWVMSQELDGCYWQPLAPERRSGENDWAKTDRTMRTLSEVQKLLSTVLIREQGGELTLEIRIEGTDHVPVAIEVGLRPGGALTGDGLVALERDPGSQLLATGAARYDVGGSSISFGPGARAHSWTQMRGALPKLKADCVYITGATPFRHVLRFF